MNKKNSIAFLTLFIVTLIGILTLVSYSFYKTTKTQEENNLLGVGCLDVQITDEKNAINLDGAIPVTDEKGAETTPFTFSIKNTCDMNSSYVLSLEMLKETTLSSDYVAIMVDNQSKKILGDLDRVNTVLDDSKEARGLTSGVLGPGESESFSIRMWLDKDTPLSSETQNKILAAKVTVTNEKIENDEKYSISGYFVNENNEIVQNAYLAVFSDKLHIVKTDIYGRVFVGGLERGVHEIYYLNKIDPTNMTKEEIKNQSIGKVETTTNHKGDIIFDNNYKIVEKYVRDLFEDSLKTYNITLNPNNGEEVLTKEVTENKIYGELPSPIKSGYKFNGWYKNDKLINSEVIVVEKESHELIAHWDANTYTVTFNANGGSLDSEENLTKQVVYNTVYGELPSATRAHHEFIGWYTSDGDKVTSTSSYMTTDNQTLYAHWQEVTAPEISGASSEWVTTNQTITILNASTALSGVNTYEYYKTTSDTAPTDSDEATGTTSNSVTVSDEGITNVYYRAVANSGIKSAWSNKQTTKKDTTGPTIPTSGAIGSVSGSNTTGTIQTAASGSTDTGVGGITYKYLITNSNSKPSNALTTWTTSKDFTRSCGTNYYGWAIAEDALGNKSEVYSLGSTSDGANSYSVWGACSKSCGSGTQTRTNTCALVTSSLSQSCNTQTCCSSTKVGSYGSWSSWGTCSKSCGTGTQTRTRTRYYVSTYDGSSCGSDTETDSQSCNTQTCCSSTKISSYGSWSSWGTCSKSCGGGTQTRTRTRYYVSTYDGSSCGSDTETDSQSCNTQSCSYTVNIDYNNYGRNSDADKTTVTYDATNAVTLPTPTRPHYTFTGWTGSNGTTPQLSVTIPAGNTETKRYQANWRLNYTIYGYGTYFSNSTESTESTNMKKRDPRNPIASAFTSYSYSSLTYPAFVRVEYSTEVGSVCIKVNGTIECFRAGDFETEKAHLINVFGAANVKIRAAQVDYGVGKSSLNLNVDYTIKISTAGNISVCDNINHRMCMAYADKSYIGCNYNSSC